MEPLTPNKRFEIENRYLSAADDLAEYERLLSERVNDSSSAPDAKRSVPDGGLANGARIKQLYDKLFGPTP